MTRHHSPLLLPACRDDAAVVVVDAEACSAAAALLDLQAAPPRMGEYLRFVFHCSSQKNETLTHVRSSFGTQGERRGQGQEGEGKGKGKGGGGVGRFDGGGGEEGGSELVSVICLFSFDFARDRSPRLLDCFHIIAAMRRQWRCWQ